RTGKGFPFLRREYPGEPALGARWLKGNQCMGTHVIRSYAGQSKKDADISFMRGRTRFLMHAPGPAGQGTATFPEPSFLNASPGMWISNRAPLPGSPVSAIVMPVRRRISRARKR